MQTSHAYDLLSWYRVLTLFNMQWIICDIMAYKYWVFHPIHFWIPSFNPLGDLFEIPA